MKRSRPAMLDVLANREATKERAALGKALMLNVYSQSALRNRYLDRLTELGLV